MIRVSNNYLGMFVRDLNASNTKICLPIISKIREVEALTNKIYKGRQDEIDKQCKEIIDKVEDKKKYSNFFKKCNNSKQEFLQEVNKIFEDTVINLINKFFLERPLCIDEFIKEKEKNHFGNLDNFKNCVVTSTSIKQLSGCVYEFKELYDNNDL